MARTDAVSSGLAAAFAGLTVSEASDFLESPVDYLALDAAGRRDALRQLHALVMRFYLCHGRVFPWRETHDTWAVLLSEVMLQQTQTSRVLPKYEAFLAHWPTWEAMAASSLDDVLFLWQGLGYPRRSLALRKVAVETERWGWKLPCDYEQLLHLPGIGPSTASAVLAFCYGEPAIYLETNVRRVLLHCLFPGHDQVRDAVLKEVLKALLDEVSDVRAWYYALMDYGVLLKFLLPNANRRSAHYARQGRYENSNRQIRGRILLQLSQGSAIQRSRLLDMLPSFAIDRIDACISSLVEDGFIETILSDPTGDSVADSDPTYRIRKG